MSQTTNVNPVDTNPSNTMVQIEFHDGVKMLIPAAVIAKYPAITPNVKIFRSSEKFKKYILPLLYSDTDSLRTSNVDTTVEVTELINEIKFYGIILTDLQCIEICENLGMTDKIDEVKNYIAKKTNKDGTLKVSAKSKIANFQNYWNGLISSIKIADFHQIYQLQPLLFTNLITLICKSEIIQLSRLNLNNNMLTIFVNYFHKYCIEENKGCLLNLQLTFNGQINLGSLTGNAVPIVSGSSSVSNNEFSSLLTGLGQKLVQSVLPSQTTSTSNIYPSV